ncbi:hypothetical protein PEX1_084630 [Penicillium expansum]|uniref:DUF3669 domain-containing protein n=1 Tax=Penicillium expansum TaxID=27334 RepID=A0A0A2KGW4_PENEN|nr:hypothetical protein PEX2_068740 [Penicillium expansum]KGO42792.1 hypothetical protein PEXP_023210 [Penicillium expansum]KGO58364.1 hypothetical protein PEX2_068740 [Penicillium expansum]KGO67039.1 hypothetical protein PEX1_084630 [Penicillium expansum]
MAQRREGKSSDESTNSEALSIAQNARISQRFLATNLGLMTDSVILKRSLSLNSVISTASSFSIRFQNARSQPNLQYLNQIGSGLQGAVFEQVGKPLALKKESPGNEKLRSNLSHEHTIHRGVSATFEYYQSINTEVHVPKPLRFISKEENSAFWDEILPKTPEPYRVRGDLVMMERILPLPKVVRKALISQFCAPEQHLNGTEIEAILNNPQNKHCLARVYLGNANGTIDRKTPLRNFPLCLDPMEQIGIETVPLANAMGKAYATLNWGGAINGDDVEFVLGTSATAAQGTDHAPNFQHRAVQLYLLDFGQCEVVDLTQDPDVVYQAFKGAMVTGDNQRFIPHYSRSPALFATFRQGYIEAGNIILSDKKLDTKFNMEDFMQEYEEYAEDFL